MVGIATVTDDNMREGYYGTVSKAMSQMHIKLCWSHNKPCPDTGNTTLHRFHINSYCTGLSLQVH